MKFWAFTILHGVVSPATFRASSCMPSFASADTHFKLRLRLNYSGNSRESISRAHMATKRIDPGSTNVSTKIRGRGPLLRMVRISYASGLSETDVERSATTEGRPNNPSTGRIYLESGTQR